MRNTALAYKEQDAPAMKAIEVSLCESFPIPIKVKNNLGRVVETYFIVKTRNNGLMLQK